MNRPLPMDAAGRPDFAANYGPGRFAAEILGGTSTWPAARSDLLVLLAFSGGGKRSAAFAHGALRGLRDIPVRPAGRPGWTLLEDVDYISGVSGGSFPAVHYGLHRERSFETFPREFLKRDINAHIWGIYLLPWNWDWLANPLVGTNDYMAAVYDQLMFRGATYADLLRRGPPLISVNATDIVNEVAFPFLGGTFGMLCSDLNSFPLARAVAASNAFPILFSPITLENHAEKCHGLRPPLDPTARWAQSASATMRRAELARIANLYADPGQTRWVHLMDGGIADNLALRGLLNILTGLEANDTLARQVALRTRRILLLSVDGEALPDRALGQRRVVSGLTQIFSAVSSTQIDAYNSETLALTAEQVRQMTERFRTLRCGEAREVNGHPCGDVEGTVVHLALSGIADPADRLRLQAIPTGLTIPDADVDALVGYGERMVRDHPVIRAYVAASGENGIVTAGSGRAPRLRGMAGR
ncbi:patatin-like phospholipase family protein [Siccirubricoccus sp. G192]|uniref:patatin-like phospholipase family protein n=1 Tax=Siccirubricoccus sp. G192 TaxID=2849651 RepID=UPI001C2CBCBF|nr:patatin-like phospholipase family protein [Siccirubricoccus sp. G192]MBV1799438.1 patatin-like phospholipase family protein [Siccirubricoccus sp. G192]